MYTMSLYIHNEPIYTRQIEVQDNLVQSSYCMHVGNSQPVLLT